MNNEFDSKDLKRFFILGIPCLLLLIGLSALPIYPSLGLVILIVSVVSFMIWYIKSNETVKVTFIVLGGIIVLCLTIGLGYCLHPTYAQNEEHQQKVEEEIRNYECLLEEREQIKERIKVELNTDTIAGYPAKIRYTCMNSDSQLFPDTEIWKDTLTVEITTDKWFDDCLDYKKYKVLNEIRNDYKPLYDELLRSTSYYRNSSFSLRETQGKRIDIKHEIIVRAQTKRGPYEIRNDGEMLYYNKKVVWGAIKEEKKTETSQSTPFYYCGPSKWDDMPDCDDYDDLDDFLDDWDGCMPDGSDAEDYWDNW